MFATLYLDDDEYVGNLALFDQNLAISWVKKHIGEFCGDDERITVFGQSFGANFLSIQLLSNYSQHLIDNAILQSGFTLFQVVCGRSSYRCSLLIESFWGRVRIFRS